MTSVSDWFKDWIKASEGPEPAPNVTPLPRPANADITAYANAALIRELDRLRATGEGSRNDQLNKAAFNLGQLVAGGELEAHDVADLLAEAARDIGLNPSEIMGTLRSGMNAGAKHPRVAPPPKEPEVTEVVELPKVDDFWEARMVLQHIRDFAYARMCSPWAVLGVCLLRALAIIPPHVVLPPLIGGYGSLNLFVSLVGPSGSGKGAAERAAKQALEFVGLPIYTASVGSGEGIAHQYAHRATAAELREQTDINGVIRDRDSVIFTVHEVNTLTALGQRQGSTLLSQLCQAFSGERLGFGYADATRRIPLEEHSYRLGMSVGVQPEKAGPIIYDEDSGTPQRFIWLPSTDPHITATPQPSPPPLVIDSREPWHMGPDGFHVLNVPAITAETILNEHAKKGRGEVEALDAHALFAREKVAQALTFLDERRVMTEEDWELSGIVMQVSDVTRAAITHKLDQQIQKIDTSRAKREASRAVLVSETMAEATVQKVSSRIAKLLKNHGEMSWSDMRKRLTPKEREHYEDAVERLVAAGMAAVEATDRGQHVKPL